MKSNQTRETINTLNTEDFVKDLLHGWRFIRRLYPKQIQVFQFTEETKEELRQFAKDFYLKYAEPKVATSTRVVFDEGVFEQSFSVLLYGQANYPLLSYPNHFIKAEALNPAILQQILQRWSTSYVDFESFVDLFWRKKDACQTIFLPTDIKVLQQLFSYVKTHSCIGFPNSRELWHPGLGFSKSTARVRYSRLINLDILWRRSPLNYAKLGLNPVLKIYDGDEIPSQPEKTFCIWENSLPNDKTLRILVIPRHSPFWADQGSKNISIQKIRCGGVNIELFDGNSWKTRDLSSLIESGFPANQMLLPQWKLDSTLGVVYPFSSLDLRLLKELAATPERQTKYFGSRTGISRSYASERLQMLRKANVFVTSFRLNNAGLTERYYILAKGSTKDLQLLYNFLCQQPRYYIDIGETALFGLVWLEPTTSAQFLTECSYLEEISYLKEFYVSLTNQKARAHLPNLVELWEKRNQWGWKQK